MICNTIFPIAVQFIIAQKAYEIDHTYHCVVYFVYLYIWRYYCRYGIATESLAIGRLSPWEETVPYISMCAQKTHATGLATLLSEQHSSESLAMGRLSP